MSLQLPPLLNHVYRDFIGKYPDAKEVHEISSSTVPAYFVKNDEVILTQPNAFTVQAAKGGLIATRFLFLQAANYLSLEGTDAHPLHIVIESDLTIRAPHLRIMNVVLHHFENANIFVVQEGKAGYFFNFKIVSYKLTENNPRTVTKLEENNKSCQ